MSSSPVLDSKPVVPPPASKRLKRSSSSVSVASLPTPPRTISKRKRSRSRASSAVDSNDDSDGSVASRPVANKRRKIQGDETREEEAFWQGTSTHEKSPKQAVQARSPSPTRSMSPEVVRVYRTQKTGLVSPPPSRRQPARKVKKSAIPSASPTRKAKGKGRAETDWPIRDSPNNPFLDDGDSSFVLKTPPRRKGPAEERPTLTYVFRGQKQEMANPLYKYKPPSNSLLPPEHPDFSPSAACPPKLLFPSAHRRQQPRKKRARSLSPSSDVDSDDQNETQENKISPMGKLAFEKKGDQEDRVPSSAVDSPKGRQKLSKT